MKNLCRIGQNVIESYKTSNKPLNLCAQDQICPGAGTNARKVISQVNAYFVLQYTVFGRKSKHKKDVTA